MSCSESDTNGATESTATNRRDFLSAATGVAMAGGLAAGYGTLAVMAGRFLYPTDDKSVGWRFVATVDQLKPGAAMTFVAPSGAPVVVARQGEGETAEDFIALSSVCPHLGCRVHWEAQNDRFFCPCHNGVFDPEGNATEGPPAQAKQRLKEFPVKVENGLLYIEAPLTSVGRSVAQRPAATRSATDPPSEEA